MGIQIYVETPQVFIGFVIQASLVDYPKGPVENGFRTQEYIPRDVYFPYQVYFLID